MAKQCGDKASKSAVEIECYVTKCKMSRQDSGNHVVEITNHAKIVFIRQNSVPPP
jgi:hypothetical protein